MDLPDILKIMIFKDFLKIEEKRPPLAIFICLLLGTLGNPIPYLSLLGG